MQYDADRDGVISTVELKGLIGAGLCRDIPYHIAAQILQKSDSDNDGDLDFEEFFQMSQRNKWMIKNVLMGYCRMIIPAPHRIEGDQIGKFFVLKLLLYVHVCMYNFNIHRWCIRKTNDHLSTTSYYGHILSG